MARAEGEGRKKEDGGQRNAPGCLWAGCGSPNGCVQGYGGMYRGRLASGEEGDSRCHSHKDMMLCSPAKPDANGGPQILAVAERRGGLLFVVCGVRVSCQCEGHAGRSRRSQLVLMMSLLGAVGWQRQAIQRLGPTTEQRGGESGAQGSTVQCSAVQCSASHMSAPEDNSRGRRRRGRDIESLDKHSRIRACRRHASVPYRSLSCLAQSHHTLKIRNRESTTAHGTSNSRNAHARSPFHHRCSARIASGLPSALVRQ
jgi:hypothetical protein